MKFCLECGAGDVAHRIPDGDTHPRHLCEGCGYVHYENPKVIAGCLPIWNEQVLLCRRAIEPRRGRWTLPAGFLELGETMEQGARRETREEANAEVEIGALYALYSVPHISQVYALFTGQMVGPDFSPGQESLDVGLYAERDIPWDEIAFPAMHKTLELYFEDRRSGRLRTHTGDIVRVPDSTEPARFRIVSR